MTAAEWCRKEGLKPGDLVDVQWYYSGKWGGPFAITGFGKSIVLLDDPCLENDVAFTRAEGIRRHVPPVVAPTADEWAEAVQKHIVPTDPVTSYAQLRALLDRHDRAKEQGK